MECNGTHASIVNICRWGAPRSTLLSPSSEPIEDISTLSQISMGGFKRQLCNVVIGFNAFFHIKKHQFPNIFYLINSFPRPGIFKQCAVNDLQMFGGRQFISSAVGGM